MNDKYKISVFVIYIIYFSMIINTILTILHAYEMLHVLK